MLTVKTSAGTFTVEEDFHHEGFRLRDAIQGSALTGGLTNIEARADLLGQIVEMSVRHYRWSPSPHGNGGSGTSGREVEGPIREEARELVQAVFTAVVGAFRLDYTAAAVPVREVVVRTPAPTATLAALLRLSGNLAGAAVSGEVTGASTFVVTFAADATDAAAQVADTVVVLGVDAHITDRIAYRTRARPLPQGRVIDLTASVPTGV